MNRRETLLPPNQTEAEAGLVSASERLKLEHEELKIKILWQIENCPEEYLDYVATGFSVDEFRLARTEEEKREILRNMMEMKRRKGTRWAISKALEIFGFSSVQTFLEEWFQYNGRPYTFRIVIDEPDFLLEKEDFKVLFGLVWAYKNARSHLEYIRFVRRLDLPLSVALARRRGLIRKITAIWDRPGCGLGLSAGFAWKEGRDRSVRPFWLVSRKDSAAGFSACGLILKRRFRFYT